MPHGGEVLSVRNLGDDAIAKILSFKDSGDYIPSDCGASESDTRCSAENAAFHSV
jgi:hypothetical protein